MTKGRKIVAAWNVGVDDFSSSTNLTICGWQDAKIQLLARSLLPLGEATPIILITPLPLSVIYVLSMPPAVRPSLIDKWTWDL